MVREVAGDDVAIETTPTDDNRSYHVNSDRIRQDLGFEPKHSIKDAIADLAGAFAKGLVPGAMTNPRYYNIKTMQELGLK